MNNDIKTKNGKYFSRFAIKGILENPVYTKNDDEMYNYFVKNNVELYSKKEEFDGNFGVMAYNKTKQVKHKATKKMIYKIGLFQFGKHKGLINGKDWISVQNLLKKQ